MSKKQRRLTKREQYVEDWFEIPMLWVTSILLVTLLIPVLFKLPEQVVLWLAAINLIVWFTFYIELFAKLFVAKNKLNALKRNWILVVIAIAPLFLSFRFIRLSRLVSLTRFLRLQKFVNRFKQGVRELIYNIEYILITLSIFVVIAGFIMWQVEERFDGSIQSLPDALWWAVITITTIGYGDMIPSSPEGKVVGSIFALIGAVLFMVFVARITTLFVHDADIAKLEKAIKRVEDQK